MEKTFVMIRSKLLIIILCSLCSLSLSAQSKDSKVRILFFGDSLTAGLGLNSPDEAFPALIEKALNQNGISCQAVNAGMSGDTTSGGLARLEWAMSAGFDLFVLELGANDSMRGISPDQTEKNLKEILTRVRKKNPKAKILLVGMKTFPNLGKEYRKNSKPFFQKFPKKRIFHSFLSLWTALPESKNSIRKTEFIRLRKVIRFLRKIFCPSFKKF